MSNKKFIACQDRDTAEKLSKSGLKRVTLWQKQGKTIWVFEYKEEFENEPGCFVTNKLFF